MFVVFFFNGFASKTVLTVVYTQNISVALFTLDRPRTIDCKLQGVLPSVDHQVRSSGIVVKLLTLWLAYMLTDPQPRCLCEIIACQESDLTSSKYF